TTHAQVDRSVRPQPGPAPVIQLGDFETFTLRNGLRVILVENRRVPMVSFQLTLDVDPFIEGNAKGFVGLAGTLMREGTTTRTKQQIDEEIDFIGANLITFGTGMFGSSLTRHKETLLKIMSDVLLNPTFPEEELQRNLKQMRSALEANRSEASFIADNVSRTALFGPEHPYGEITTPETLENITTSQLREYHQTFFKPNVAYLVIVGDIGEREARRLARRYFGRWKPGEVPETKFETPVPPAGNRVVFANKPGASQSLVEVTYPLVYTPGNPDAIKASVMNSILGGGVFSGRLMQNLREDKGFTYGARSFLSSDPLVGRFRASTEVRNSVTDSTIVEILGEMRRLVNEPVDEETLQLVKNFMSGSFARALENPRTIAGFALNVKLYNLPEDYYATYLANLQAVTADDVQRMAAKYLKPDNAIIVVVGNRDEVVPTLKRFSADGTVALFNEFGQPVEGPREAGEGLTANYVIDKYVDAIGGAKLLKEVKDVTINMSATLQGMTISALTKQKFPNLFYSSLSLGGNIIQKQVFDGTRGSMTAMGQTREITGDELTELKLQATLFPEMKLEDLGYTIELMGIETINDQAAYRIRVTSPTGRIRHDYFSTQTYLKLSSHISQDTPMGQMTVITNFDNYQEVNGILFPFTVKQQLGPQMLDLKVSSVEINTGLGADAFKVE
ncbi:MAG TPA: pitrilysin family protein, partial [Bacteroidales bacterium]|nr:pitrilysin family protein [Bacteroidales bacterium]